MSSANVALFIEPHLDAISEPSRIFYKFFTFSIGKHKLAINRSMTSKKFILLVIDFRTTPVCIEIRIDPS